MSLAKIEEAKPATITTFGTRRACDYGASRQGLLFGFRMSPCQPRPAWLGAYFPDPLPDRLGATEPGFTGDFFKKAAELAKNSPADDAMPRPSRGTVATPGSAAKLVANPRLWQINMTRGG